MTIRAYTLGDIIQQTQDLDSRVNKGEPEKMYHPLFNEPKPGMVIPDMVNQPPHYTLGGIETIDYMKAKSTPEEFRGHLRLTAIKYLSRAGHKDDTLQDYKKARWYLDKLIKELEQL